MTDLPYMISRTYDFAESFQHFQKNGSMKEFYTQIDVNGKTYSVKISEKSKGSSK